MPKTLSQGRLDGLCGLYSVINTYENLYSIGFSKCEKLFKELISHKADLFPTALHDGTELPVVIEWAHAASEILRVNTEITQPFSKKRFVSTEDYFSELNPLVRPADTVAIVGLGKPWDHWTVIRAVRGRTVSFCDSYGLISKKTDWFSIKTDPDRTRIITKETVLITRID